jgi:hypothetical protein
LPFSTLGGLAHDVRWTSALAMGTASARALEEKAASPTSAPIHLGGAGAAQDQVVAAADAAGVATDWAVCGLPTKE